MNRVETNLKLMHALILNVTDNIWVTALQRQREEAKRTLESER